MGRIARNHARAPRRRPWSPRTDLAWIAVLTVATAAVAAVIMPEAPAVGLLVAVLGGATLGGWIL
jgi:hypothetical protein